MPTAPANPLVFDVGANNGDDTEYYLKKGFRVVAIEANPELADHIAHRFSTEILTGRVVILNVALVGDSRSEVAFFINRFNDKISTVINQKDIKKEFREIKVRAEQLSNLIDQYGMPFFIKVDIEGSDYAVVKEIFDKNIYPEYMSIEFKDIQMLTLLVIAGYTSFYVVEGQRVSSPYYQTSSMKDKSGRDILHAFPPHSAGPFYDDIPGPWLQANEVVEYVCAYGLGWKDIHATRQDQATNTTRMA